MKQMKRIFAFVLAVLMCVTCVVPVVAADTDCLEIHTKAKCEAAGITYTEITVHEAVCGDKGYTVYQCDTCGVYFSDDWVDAPGKHNWSTTTVDATCTEAGSVTTECTLCGKKTVETIPAKGHTWDNGVVSVDPFYCDIADAVKVYTCTVCGETKEEAIEAGDHAWGEPELITAPTCEAEGLAKYTCADCGDTKEVKILKLGHNAVVDAYVAPTCTETGLTAGSHCSNCGEVIHAQEVIPALGHTVEEWTIDAEASCTATGSKSGVCVVCGETVTETIPMESHDLSANAGISVYPESCEKEGYEVWECANCDYSENRPIPAGTHSYGTEPSYTTEPTCTEWGHTYYACTKCGYHEARDPQPPIHHGTLVTDEEASYDPTCTEDGLLVQYYEGCTCGYTKETVVPATGHSNEDKEVEATCNAYGYTYKECSVCGEKSNYVYGTTYDPTNHGDNLVKGAITTPPTCTEKGVQLEFCKVCNYYADAPVDALGHEYDVEKGATIVATAEPTCEDQGYTTYQCARCEETHTEYTDALGHALDEGTTVGATCMAQGYTLYSCTRDNCDYTEKADFFSADKNDLNAHTAAHLYVTEDTDENGVYRPGSCTIIGLYQYKCDDCGHMFYVAIDGTGEGHVKTNITEYKAPTCTEAGNEEGWTCSVCGEVKEATEIPATGHTEVVDVEVPATCTKPGTSAGSHCSVCGEVLSGQEEIPAKGHAIVIDAAVAPTCTETGLTQGEHCSVCDYKLAQEVVPALGHTYEVADDRTADCLLWGYSHKVCAVCEDESVEYIDEYVAAKGHTEVVDEAVEPSCSATGLTEGKHCSECGTVLVAQTEIGKVPHANAAGDELVNSCESTVEDRVCKYCGETIGQAHNFVVTLVPATCSERSYELWVCVVCEYDEMKNWGSTREHKMGDWVVTTEPTYTTPGVETRECIYDDCDHSEDRPCTLTGVSFETKVSGYNVAKGETREDIVNGGYVAVEIDLASYDTEFWAAKINMTYNTEWLTFDADLTNAMNVDNVLPYSQINDLGGEISIVRSFTADAKEDYVLENESVHFITLYFAVAEDAPVGTAIDFTFSGEQVVDSEGGTVDGVSKDLTGIINLLGDMDGDGNYDLLDAQSIMAILSTGTLSTDAVADIDMSGEVDLADFAEIQKYIVGIFE